MQSTGICAQSATRQSKRLVRKSGRLGPRSTVSNTRPLNTKASTAKTSTAIKERMRCHRSSSRWSRKDMSELVFAGIPARSEEHTSELQSRPHLVCRLLLEKKKKTKNKKIHIHIKMSHDIMI